jgi:hypothetical protein
VQHPPEILVARRPHVLQRLIETRDRPLVRLLVLPVAAVHPDDGGLVSMLAGIGWRPSERLGPVRGEALGVPRVETVAERMADHLVLQRPGVPRAGQFQQPVEAPCGFVNGLHGPPKSI